MGKSDLTDKGGFSKKFKKQSRIAYSRFADANFQLWALIFATLPQSGTTDNSAALQAYLIMANAFAELENDERVLKIGTVVSTGLMFFFISEFVGALAINKLGMRFVMIMTQVVQFAAGLATVLFCGTGTVIGSTNVLYPLILIFMNMTGTHYAIPNTLSSLYPPGKADEAIVKYWSLCDLYRFGFLPAILVAQNANIPIKVTGFATMVMLFLSAIPAMVYLPRGKDYSECLLRRQDTENSNSNSPIGYNTETLKFSEDQGVSITEGEDVVTLVEPSTKRSQLRFWFIDHPTQSLTLFLICIHISLIIGVRGVVWTTAVKSIISDDKKLSHWLSFTTIVTCFGAYFFFHNVFFISVRKGSIYTGLALVCGISAALGPLLLLTSMLPGITQSIMAWTTIPLVYAFTDTMNTVLLPYYIAETLQNKINEPIVIGFVKAAVALPLCFGFGCYLGRSGWVDPAGNCMKCVTVVDVFLVVIFLFIHMINRPTKQ